MIPTGASPISLWLLEILSREWEKRTKNKRTIWAWVNSSAKRLSCDTLHSLCICRLTLAWISSEIFTKLQGMPTHLDWSSLTAAGLYLMRLVSQMSGVDCPSASPFANCPQWVPSSNSPSRLSRTCLSYPTSGLVRDLESKPFVWFRAKIYKGIVCSVDHLHRVTDVRKTFSFNVYKNDQTNLQLNVIFWICIPNEHYF